MNPWLLAPKKLVVLWFWPIPNVVAWILFPRRSKYLRKKCSQVYVREQLCPNRQFNWTRTELSTQNSSQRNANSSVVSGIQSKITANLAVCCWQTVSTRHWKRSRIFWESDHQNLSCGLYKGIVTEELGHLRRVSQYFSRRATTRLVLTWPPRFLHPRWMRMPSSM